MNLQPFLLNLGACEDARVWASKRQNLKTAWAKCQNPQWMLWLLTNTDYQNSRTLRLLACRFVSETPLGDGRTVWDLLTDERSRNAIRVSRRFAYGKATQQELDAAGDAAGAAAWDAAWDAAGDAQCHMIRRAIPYSTVLRLARKNGYTGA